MNPKLLLLLIAGFGAGTSLSAQTVNQEGQSRLAKEERQRYIQDSLLRASLDSNLQLLASKAYILENFIRKTDSRLSDPRIPKGPAGGDLNGLYPNPTIKNSVTLQGNPTVTGNLRLKGPGNYGNKLNFGDGDFVYLHEESDDNLTIKAKNITLSTSSGSVTAPTPNTTENSTKIATTAYVKSNLLNYVTTGDNRLTNSRIPMGAAGGDLGGVYPNPTIKSSVALTGTPTAPTPTATDNSTRIATTAHVKNALKTVDASAVYQFRGNRGGVSLTISPGEGYHTTDNITVTVLQSTTEKLLKSNTSYISNSSVKQIYFLREPAISIVYSKVAKEYKNKNSFGLWTLTWTSPALVYIDFIPGGSINEE